MPYSIYGGVLKGARFSSSPNFCDRPEACEIELLVIHCISLPPGVYGSEQGGQSKTPQSKSHHLVEDFFCNQLDCSQHDYFEQLRELKVSAHLFVERDGKVTQFVNFNQQAWHAGVSSFNGRERCNEFSIGIELEGLDTDTYTDPQYETLAKVTRALQKAYPKITMSNIVGHEHIAPERKLDPGPHFDWARYKNFIYG